MLSPAPRALVWRAAGIALVLAAIAGALAFIHLRSTDDRLLRTEPANIRRDPALLGVAVDLGRPLYQTHCATCHGAALEGDAARGAPNLAEGAWLYGNDPVEVEHTILYGIRSGHPKSRNVTDMPALVRSGQITDEEARDVVEFLRELAGASYDPQMSARGRAVYYDKGNCFDCHASDARGASDYGAPGLTGPVWLYGGDRQTLFLSIRNGRHGRCPAWVDKLAPVQVRALTLYLLSVSRADIARN